MATDTTPFSPFLTQQHGLDAQIVDRNLLAIKKALDDANATINRQQTVINRLIQTVNVNVSGGSSAAAITPPGIDMGQSDGDSEFPLIIPGKPGQDGKAGAPSPPGQDGEDGDPWLVPGPRGAQGDSIKGPPGITGDDGDDGASAWPDNRTMGMPLGVMPNDFGATGDVMRFVNNDSTVRGADGYYPYSRTVAGPYVIFDPAVLTIEDNAIVTVI